MLLPFTACGPWGGASEALWLAELPSAECGS